MAVSIKDIARAAGVSHSTVSRALADSPLVRDETKQRIRHLAREMGYSPSAIARGLVTKRTRTIGLVVTTIADPFVAEVVRGVEETALDRGYNIVLCNSNAEPQRELAAVNTLREKRVDGIIVSASRVGDLYLPMLVGTGVPIVLVNNEHSGSYAYSVVTDDEAGGRLATEYLLDLGHTKIAYISGPELSSTSANRLRGYEQALKARGLMPDLQWIVPGNGSARSGEEGMARLLSLADPPSAVFCYNDVTAIGALLAARRLGWNVPGQVSVMGYDDIAFAAYTNPALTTVEQRKYEMGSLAMKMMLDLLDGAASVENVLLPPHLIERESCAPPNPGEGSEPSPGFQRR
ncbi:MAG: LacI family transcriptional regulator [Anaerolineae bacterium]|jgi:DNA-binding LacI/PurR family transcriptional regulator|nr:LacI family transcriptional regulator [Anaerolineae bacterium]MDH7472683.1 LacI family DNA-binding transcriptional regulator [Anaerolineae bacterium]